MVTEVGLGAAGLTANASEDQLCHQERTLTSACWACKDLLCPTNHSHITKAQTKNSMLWAYGRE